VVEEYRRSEKYILQVKKGGLGRRRREKYRNKKGVTLKEQRAEIREQKGKSSDQQRESLKQRAESKEQRAAIREQIKECREQRESSSLPADAAVGVDLHPQCLDVVSSVGASREVRQVELDL
jgi:hypothetical protein